MRLLVLTPYRIYPPDVGGRAHIYSLCSAYAQQVDEFAVHSVVTLKDPTSWPDAPFSYHATRAWVSLLSLMDRLKVAPKIPYFWAMSGLTRKLAKRIEALNPDVVEVHFPWLMGIRRHLPDNIRVVLAAHNVEALWYRNVMETGLFAKMLERRLQKIEGEALGLADHVLCLAERDRQEFARRYTIPLDKMVVCPPGYDPDMEKPNGAKAETQRQVRRALFIGSKYPTNIEAAMLLIDEGASSVSSEVELVIAGEVCDHISTSNIPDNVKLAGYVPDLKALLHTCDILVNPSVGTTGAHIKNVDALACGLRVITTPEGAHGFESLCGDIVRVAAIEDFATHINGAESLNDGEMERVREYAWPALVKKRIAHYESSGAST